LDSPGNTGTIEAYKLNFQLIIFMTPVTVDLHNGSYTLCKKFTHNNFFVQTYPFEIGTQTICCKMLSCPII